MRFDGLLTEAMNRADVPVKRIVSRLKVMAELDIAETRLPQDGRIPLSLGGRIIDTRVSSLPRHLCSRVSVERLGTDGQRLSRWRRKLSGHHGCDEQQGTLPSYRQCADGFIVRRFHG